MSELHLYDFGVFVELSPDEEEKQLLENNIQVAISQQAIDLEDAIDLREIKNVKLANRLLKIRRAKKVERDQRLQQENMRVQAQANAQAAQQAAQTEMQKQQAEMQMEMQLEEQKSKLKSQEMMMEADLKKQLMDHDFAINLRLNKMEVDAIQAKDMEKEDRKDVRTKIQATQQSQLIEQRNKDLPPTNFESKFDNIMSGVGTGIGVYGNLNFY